MQIKVIRAPEYWKCQRCGHSDIKVLWLKTIPKEDHYTNLGRFSALCGTPLHDYSGEYYCPKCYKKAMFDITPTYDGEIVFEFTEVITDMDYETFLTKHRRTDCTHFLKTNRTCSLFEDEYRTLTSCPYHGVTADCEVLKRIYEMIKKE